ncbi:MAG: TMEM175 family protein [Ginsengibacter sp.]
MFRKAVVNKFEKRNDFRFRGHEVRRIEAFSDAVFAFAVTLLIVSLEVPKNFKELMATMHGFFAFGVSFVLLMCIWYEQNIFFRRYGLDDLVTIVLNCILIFLVLFYVYPLKFLFTLLFSNSTDQASLMMKARDNATLMIIYSVGYISIYALFSVMHFHALRKKEELELTPLEIFDTKTKIYKNLILIVIGIISVVMAMVLKPGNAGLAGFVYFLIGPAFTIFFTYRNKRKKVVKATDSFNSNG